MKTSLLILFLVVPLLLTACGAAPSQPTPDVAFVQTSAAKTVIANFTNTAAAAVTFTPLAAVTTAPAPQATATLIPATTVGTLGPTATLLPGGVTATKALCDHYTWNPTTIDVNIPDGTQMTPGQQFVKTWKIKNDGVCTWGAGYKIVYAGYTDQMSGVPQPINGVIGPGQEVEISVQFKAPLKAGEYVSAWTLQNASGIRFYGPAGRPIYVKIVSTLKQLILEEARRLGFVLAGVTTPEPPPHGSVFEDWLAKGRHASMRYLETERSRLRRADPTLILPGCKSVLVLALPYAPPPAGDMHNEHSAQRTARLAAYAAGDDYHDVLPPRLHLLVQSIEAQVGHSVANRCYTDSGPILERDLAQRAGLGWIGKNTCLINPRHGSYFLLAEILLDLELEPDAPFRTDQCGTCTRCIDACPTDCILPDRTIDAGRCISYLTIELKEEIPDDLRPALGDRIFGCDVCQSVCPWNRFAGAGDPGLAGRSDTAQPDLLQELQLSPEEFHRKFKHSPVRRAKRRGYLRNVAVALGNTGTPDDLPVLAQALQDPEPLVREHAAWAMEQIRKRGTG